MHYHQNVLIVGGGGREHALAWKIAQSPKLGRLYVAPGNGGTSSLATNVPIKASDIDGLVTFAKNHGIGLTIVAPDDALAAGLVDALSTAGLRAFGPTKAAALIESSKVFAKDLMTTEHIPTSRYRTFENLKEADSYIGTCALPVVVKASGLALGKGVFICTTKAQASDALHSIMAEKIFGESGSSVVVEEFLEGQEVSIHAFCDASTSVLFPVAQDHKRIGTGDTGPNTGGMGTYAPVPWTSPRMIEQIRSSMVESALSGLDAAGAPFKGILYPGLMITDHGIKVLEFNARFGDPETQSYMRLLKTDLLDILNACVDSTLDKLDIEWSGQTAVCIVIASGGYPEKYDTGLPITGLDAAAKLPDIVVFHAGTKRENDRLLTAGGRVLGVTAVGKDLSDARAKAYAAVKLIKFKDQQYRTDIGNRSLPAEETKHQP